MAAVVIGALNLFPTPELGKNAAVAVPQFEPVPVSKLYVPLVVVVVCTYKPVM